MAARRPVLEAVARRGGPDPRAAASSAFLPDAPIEIVERDVRDWPLRYGAYRVDGLHGLGRDRPDPRPARSGAREASDQLAIQAV